MILKALTLSGSQSQVGRGIVGRVIQLNNTLGSCAGVSNADCASGNVNVCADLDSTLSCGSGSRNTDGSSSDINVSTNLNHTKSACCSGINTNNRCLRVGVVDLNRGSARNRSNVTSRVDDPRQSAVAIGLQDVLSSARSQNCVGASASANDQLTGRGEGGVGNGVVCFVVGSLNSVGGGSLSVGCAIHAVIQLDSTWLSCASGVNVDDRVERIGVVNRDRTCAGYTLNSDTKGGVNPNSTVPDEQTIGSAIEPELTDGVSNGTTRGGVRGGCRNLAGTDFNNVVSSVLVVEAASGCIVVES